MELAASYLRDQLGSGERPFILRTRNSHQGPPVTRPSPQSGGGLVPRHLVTVDGAQLLCSVSYVCSFPLVKCRYSLHGDFIWLSELAADYHPRAIALPRPNGISLLKLKQSFFFLVTY